MKKQIKKGLKWSLFLLSSAVFASPLAIPHNSSKLYPTVTQGNIGVGSVNGKLQDIVLVYENIPNAYHTTSPINLRAYLSYFYNYGDYNPKLVVYIAGGQGGTPPYEGASLLVGGTGGITIFTAPLANFIKKFGPTVSFYYVVGGEGLVNTTSIFANGTLPGRNDHWGGGGGGASMVAVNNWPHDEGGVTLAIAGGGGGSGNDSWGGGGVGGGGGGGNDCGENAPIGMSDSLWRISGLGGCHGQGGGDWAIPGGQATPNLIDISGGGGGGFGAEAGSGGGTGTAGNGGTSSPLSGGGGCGYQPGGNGDGGIPFCPGDSNYSGGYSPDGGNGGFGGGGGCSEGSDTGGGGGYGGGGGALRSGGGGGGGGGGYCLDANHSPANNPSLGAELGSSCQAIDWKHPYEGVYGHYGNGFVEIYIQP